MVIEFIDSDHKYGCWKKILSYFESTTISVEDVVHNRQRTIEYQSGLDLAAEKFACTNNLERSSYLMGLLNSP